MDMHLPAPATGGGTALDGGSLGTRLRRIRHDKGWTLSDASQRTGLSLSALSKIERGELSPTLSTLGKLALGFEMDVAALLAPAAPGDASPSGVGGRRSINRDSDGVLHPTSTCQNTWLAADLRHKRMLPIRTRVSARNPNDYAEWAVHSGEIFVYVLRGVLVVHSTVYSPVIMRRDDSLYYDATVGTKWTSQGRSDALVLWVYA